MEKRKRRTKAEMEEFRNKTLTEITKKELQETYSDFSSTSVCASTGDVNLTDEGDSEGDEEEYGLPANFIIKIANEDHKVKAYRDYWALQRWVVIKDKDTKQVTGGYWASFKYFANLGQLANRVFDLRLKNSEVNNLNELTETAKKLCKEIKEEFEVKIKGVKH